ncbi:hypothetical protein BGX31_005277, partial [Mortierella sp. GBA43]
MDTSVSILHHPIDNNKEISNIYDNDHSDSDDDSIDEYQGTDADGPIPYREFMPSLKTMVCEVLQPSEHCNGDDADEMDEEQQEEQEQEQEQWKQHFRNKERKGKPKAKGSKIQNG